MGKLRKKKRALPPDASDRIATRIASVTGRCPIIRDAFHNIFSKAIQKRLFITLAAAHLADLHV